MGEDLELNGVNFHVQIEARGNRWTWWYQVQGGQIHLNQDNPVKSQSIARSDAIEAAHREIRLS